MKTHTISPNVIRLVKKRLMVKDFSGCVDLGFQRNEKGYARVWCSATKTNYRAARVVAWIHLGGFDLDLTVDHLCRTTWCCNPHHLEIVSVAENLSRRHEVTGALILSRVDGMVCPRCSGPLTIHRQRGYKRCRQCERRPRQ